MMIDLKTDNDFVNLIYQNLRMKEDQDNWKGNAQMRADSFSMTIKNLVRNRDTAHALDFLEEGHQKSVWNEFPQKESDLYSEVIVTLVHNGEEGSAVELHKKAIARNIDLNGDALKALKL